MTWLAMRTSAPETPVGCDTRGAWPCLLLLLRLGINVLVMSRCSIVVLVLADNKNMENSGFTMVEIRLKMWLKTVKNAGFSNLVNMI